MNNKFFILFIIPCFFCIEEILREDYDTKIEYKEDQIIISGKEVEYNKTTVNITSSGSYLVTGICNEGLINIYSDSVYLYLENLELSSSIDSPIYIDRYLKDIKIIALNNVNISDYEERSTTGGDCATIKIKRRSEVTFYNYNSFYIKGTCKNVIKGASNVSLIFESTPGEYIIDAFYIGIASEGSILFKGGIFNITTEISDGIHVKPDANDIESLGNIIIKDGTFYIRSHCDAFQSRNKIEIENGNFDIKTGEGFNDSHYDSETGNAKGFEVTNNKIGSEIIIYNGNFIVNTPDDSFHSDGNLTLINGNYTIYSSSDAIQAFDYLLIGEKNSVEGPNISIMNCKEGIEGKNLVINSGKINIKSKNDGINSSKKNKTNEINSNSKPNLNINGGEINIIYNDNGLDSNGDINLLGGDINLIGGEQGNEPIDYSGEFKLSNSSLIYIGKKGNKTLNEIIKGNQNYAEYNESIEKNKLIKIKNGNNITIKTVEITEETNYIFYTSYNLNENYTFYFSDIDGTNEEIFNVTFGKLKKEEIIKEEEEKDDDNWVWIILGIVGVFVLAFIIFLIVRAIKRKNGTNN